ncbi:thioredoxin family protein [Aureibacter tunicatorum]|uniref:Thioredoxin-related protein n=1 Tax=Aureibacter tunicatorum TaxID=866807 RepID=A0AAE3XPC4_9BACT|nr:thioredoxin family protein [Aureibacter tunicatorum]MDR6239476.1 thioredoxin-related protein [Aureibacter tunicatorum]BDD04602.1 thioredoxin [Aureibacter tunicatorum]
MKRKIHFLLLILFLASTSAAFAGGNEKNDEATPSKIKWVTLSEAEQLSKKNPKKVIIDMYTTWCYWCKVMDKKTFSNDDVAAYINDNYYAVKLNAEEKKMFDFQGAQTNGPQLTSTFGVTGYPTLVVLDSNMKRIKNIVGFQEPEKLIANLK